MLPKDNNKKAQTTSGIVLLIVVLLLIIVYYLWIVYRGNDDGDVDIAIVTFPDRNAVINTEVETPTLELEEYRDDAYGFELSYTDDWIIGSETTGSGVSEIYSVTMDQNDDSVTINVMDPEMEGLVRSSIASVTETTIKISGIDAIRLDGNSLKDGSPVSILLVEKSGSLYSIQGNGDGFDEIVSGFQFR